MSHELNSDLIECTAKIAVAYFQTHPIPAADAPRVITAVRGALAGLGSAAVEPAAAPVALAPAVKVSKSVADDHLVCLEDGLHVTILTRHLKTAHGLTPAEYRAKWRLPADYPMTPPAYAEARSAMAKRIGLGRTVSRKRAAVKEAPKVTRRRKA